MSTDLVAFLRAQLDEDERAARAAALYPGKRWRPGSDGRTVFDDDGAELIADMYGPETRPRAEHIARHDPARVLAEVAAKRELLDEHRAVQEYTDQMGGSPLDPDRMVCAACGDQGRDDNAVTPPCRTVRLLALPYDGHPDYQSALGPE